MESPTLEPGYFKRYTNLVKIDNLFLAFDVQRALIDQLFQSITEQQSNYAYLEGKWTIKGLLQHIIDSERIFCYRALCFARREEKELPSFEENEYAQNAFAETRSWQSIYEEMLVVRRATLLLFKSFTPEALLYAGRASNQTYTVETIGFIIIGHLYHHVNVLKERYGVALD
ncbi:MAG: DinB family protein [Ferruginibacter sp.]